MLVVAAQAGQAVQAEQPMAQEAVAAQVDM
jgi:hypothetical protein